MEPLFLAVICGCNTGLFREALHEVYIPRIQRGDVSFASRILGAREALLSVLIHFFEDGRWGSLVETGTEGQSLTAEDRLFILMQAGLHLSVTRGFAAPEARICYERAESLCHSKRDGYDVASPGFRGKHVPPYLGGTNWFLQGLGIGNSCFRCILQCAPRHGHALGNFRPGWIKPAAGDEVAGEAHSGSMSNTPSLPHDPDPVVDIPIGNMLIRFEGKELLRCFWSLLTILRLTSFYASGDFIDPLGLVQGTGRTAPLDLSTLLRWARVRFWSIPPSL